MAKKISKKQSKEEKKSKKNKVTSPVSMEVAENEDVSSETEYRNDEDNQDEDNHDEDNHFPNETLEPERDNASDDESFSPPLVSDQLNVDEQRVAVKSNTIPFVPDLTKTRSLKETTEIVGQVETQQRKNRKDRIRKDE
jgi:hypothetical protein